MDELASAPALLELTTTAPVAGGAALAREASGRVVFVAGALPGERVAAEVVEEHRDFARARAVEVLEPSPDRVAPPCPFVGPGCGGCDLQHLRVEAQPALKRAVVVDALRRIGHVADAEDRVDLAPALPATGYRTSVRGAVVEGRFAFRMRHSHEPLAVDDCLVAHPAVDELLATGRFGRAAEVTIRVGAATGDRLVLVDPTAEGIEVPAGVVVVGADALDEHPAPWIHEVVSGARLRISARSFFQPRPDGAAALVDAVRELGGAELADAEHVVDAYAGVGLFAATIVPDGARVTAVEWNRSSIADARANLAGRDATILRLDVARWRAAPADVVVADPARTGLGRRATAALVAAEPSALVLVSCDPAALARDVTLLATEGYAYDRSLVVDLFPHTHHIEVASRFVREDPA